MTHHQTHGTAGPARRPDSEEPARTQVASDLSAPALPIRHARSVTALVAVLAKLERASW